ncbi:MAG: RHS repeat domain-containing protein [Fibrobacter intestinalis]|uniref:RHS repeat domain-containing protein n=1 Tax=Fibrobacter intestinalis TaxID=28122 RepID=UPI003F070341
MLIDFVHKNFCPNIIAGVSMFLVVFSYVDSTRLMSADSAFVYDRDGNLVEDRSKNLKIAYDWRGMPVEFVRKIDDDSLKLVMLYDGSGRRISKTRLRKETGASEWTKERATHYTGIGTEIRENFTENDSSTKVVVNMPQGLGRYGMESDDGTRKGNDFYLKNHLGSTMMVARVAGSDTPAEVIAAYDYRSFGEQVDLMPPAEKVTETFTGKELDDETELNYFGARYLDPMLGLWISVDLAGQFASPYLYAGNGLNPINGVDEDGDVLLFVPGSSPEFKAEFARAIQYLNNGKSSSVFAALQKRKEIVYIKEAGIDETYIIVVYTNNQSFTIAIHNSSLFKYFD